MRLMEIVERGLLHAVYQPLVDFRSGEVYGYEGLIRGPEGSPLHSPAALFSAARVCGLSLEVELQAQRTVITGFARRGLPGKLFVNVSPESFSHQSFQSGETLTLVRALGLIPSRVVMELTENHPVYDFRAMRDVLLAYRRTGFEIALDDLGEGFASLRLWSELQPDYVKIDMHFVQGINLDPLKLQFLKAIQQIAQSEGSQVVAEGIETEAELRVVRDLGISLGQGYFIARPAARPPVATPEPVLNAIRSTGIAVYPTIGRPARRTVTAERLLVPMPPVSPETSNDRVFSMFDADDKLRVIPVVRDGQPLGLIPRSKFVDAFARPYRRELFGRRPCGLFVDPRTLIVDKNVSIHQLSRAYSDSGNNYLLDAFIIADAGRYAGIGTGQDLIREITELQLEAARHANPLTLLPGSVPISEHVDRLLASGAAFCACHCDLDNFKPFNDVYGFRRGDELIQITAQVLAGAVDPELDFLGHIGGDDFFVVFQTPDWEERCQSILRRFGEASRPVFAAEDLERGGFAAEDRRGNPVFFPLTTLSIGAVVVEAGGYASHQEVAAAAAAAKHQAKCMVGSALFVERRRPRSRRG